MKLWKNKVEGVWVNCFKRGGKIVSPEQHTKKRREKRTEKNGKKEKEK